MQKFKSMVVKGDQRLLLEALDFAPVGEASNELNFSYGCCELPGGWCVFVSDYSFDMEGAAQTLPRGHLALVNDAYDVVMFSSVRAYDGGVPVWSVVHDPEKDLDGVTIEGKPPEPLAELMRKFDAKQAAEKASVDHIFDLPGALTKALCDYAPGQQVGVWTVLGANGSRIRPAAQSISGAIRSQVLPYLESLGWEVAKGRIDLSAPDQIMRRVGGQTQSIYFEFMSGPQTYIETIFETEGKRASGESHPLRGIVDARRMPPRPGKWQGFFKPRGPAPDPIDDAIEQAKADILLVEEFLKTDVRPSAIQFYRQWEPDEDGNLRSVGGDVDA